MERSEIKRDGESPSPPSSPPLKRARTQAPGLGLELRILIPSRLAGNVIGKGGDNISRLRSENKATIRVPDCPGPERLISISADEEDEALAIFEKIVPKLEDSGGGNVEVRLLLHQLAVGGVIGRGGAKIKELRQTTGAFINVYGTPCPSSTERVVGVSGRTETVLRAVKQIALLVNEESKIKPIKGPSVPYDPYDFDEMRAWEYGGFGDPRRRGGGSREGPSRDDGLHRPRSSERAFDEEKASNTSTTEVTIPNAYAGAIIGSRGSRIQRIREESGATITIHNPLHGSSDRIISVSGDSTQINAALYLLKQSVIEHGGTAPGSSTSNTYPCPSSEFLGQKW